MRIKVSIDAEPGRNIRLRWRDPDTGRWRKRTTDTRSRDKALRIAARLEAELESGRSLGGTAWEIFRDRFDVEHLNQLKASTRSNYDFALNRFERDMGKPADLGSVTSSRLSLWASHMRSVGLREASVASNLRFVRGALSWAAKVGLIAATPKVLMPSGSSSRGRAVTLLEFARYLSAVRSLEPSPQTAATLVDLAKLMWLSGLRLREALEVGWTDASPIMADLDATPPAFHFRVQKSGRQETIPMAPDCARFLRRHKPCGNATDGVASRKIFPGLAYSTVIKRFIRAGKKSGVRVSPRKHVTAHDLRRTFGQRWSLRVHPIVLKTIMRHSSIETTLRYYVSADQEGVGQALWAPLTGGGSPSGKQLGNQLDRNRVGRDMDH